MDTEQICQKCGAPLPTEAPEGLCPKCLLQVAMGSQAGTQPAAGPGAGPRAACPLPDPGLLAQWFPQLQILELLGQGGMGAVYKARQPGLDRLVALKILPLQASAGPGFAERFTREARALAKLSHPNIVAVYDFGQNHGLHYFIMEFVDGANLRQVEQSGKLTPREALQIIPQICEALQFAHDEGIVHRDIKPENVLVDKKGRVKIADFGLAKILGREPRDLRLTGARDVMGTPHYMAPEQVEHPQAVDHRADIYSLGVVFYEMLTGELPLGRFAPPSSRMHGLQVDVRLDEVVLHALEKEPDRRYQKAREVKTDVETIAASPGPAQPAPTSNLAATASGLEDVWRQVRGPGIGLVITGILDWVAIPLIFFAAWFLSAGGMEGRAGFGAHKTYYLALVPLAALLLGGAIFVAGLKLKRLEAYPLAVLGSVLAVFTSPGNVLGLPIGVWALVVLCRRSVRESFGQGHAPLPPQPGLASLSLGWKLAGATAAMMALLLAIPSGAVLLSIALPALSRARAGHYQGQPAFVVSGTVTDALTGQPIGHARVADHSYGVLSDRPARESWTGADGRYQLRTRPEQHALVASAPGYQSSLATLLVSAPGREHSASLDFALQPANDGLAGAPPDPASTTVSLASPILSVPPVVVETVPVSGASDVDPALTELRVTFNAPMLDGSWSWSTWGEENFPETTGSAHYLADGRTCVLPVKLKPGKFYAIWINSEKFQNFIDRRNQPAVPYLLIFQTRR